ncbi:MAG TPA: DNA polymerase III subunit gamma/tau [Candidatus Sphingobacterium stercoripullorum]|uniref:DNA polymerase III subunit gamma/tau n=1 Tax=Candidatus Sphingobacterium stercoripullorum TaxID=2838759 RepID=A0A9D2AZM2_9SPHI|nr:DNA polymerase III subunit gamma/tau [Candidatus Sphingobacterium stercoripullorum]
MSDFIVSARKYRPATFSTVVGQKHITSTLKNAISNQQLAQAFLFCGPRGVGKTTCARILAKTINCENLQEDIEACGTCNSCQSFQRGNSMSIHELDAASNNSVEDIRELIEQVRIPPQTGKYKIYIIDEVHMLSQAAFNAFLKTLEEPPSYAIFILATTEKHKILPTILSRCQIFDFNRIKVEDMAEHLKSIAEKEEVSYEMDGLQVIAQKADGGLRDALSMFDQIVSFTNHKITYQAVIDNLNILDYDYYFKLVEQIKSENTAEALLLFDQVISKGFEGGHFIAGLASHFRNLLVARDPRTLKLLEVSDNTKQKYISQSQSSNTGLLLSALNIASQCEANYRLSNNKRLHVELALIKMCHLSAAIHLSKLPDKEIQGEKKNSVVEQKAETPSSNETETRSATEAPAPVKENQSAPKLPEESLNDSAVKAEPVVAGQVNSDSSQDVKKNEPTTRQAIAPGKSTQTFEEDSKTEDPANDGWGNFSSSIIPDLNKILNPDESDEEELQLVVGSAKNEITWDVFIKTWNEFAEKQKVNNRLTLYTIMTANEPTLENNTVEVPVENSMQLNELRTDKIEILNHLRVVLENYELDLVGKLIEVPVTRKPYTSAEKYQAMAEKNPFLDLLRTTFDLGIN